MQEFKEAFFIRSATTLGVIVVIVRAIKVRARPCKVRRMYLFIVRSVRLLTFPKSPAKNKDKLTASKNMKNLYKIHPFSKSHNFLPMYVINIVFFMNIKIILSL